LISNGIKLFNFVADSSTSSEPPYLINESDYIFENSYNIIQPMDLSYTPDRPSSVAIDNGSAVSAGLMHLMTHFLYNQRAFDIQTPNGTYNTTINAETGGFGNLGSAATQCTSGYGRAPTSLLVDFINFGPAIARADRLNGISNSMGRSNVSTAVSEAKCV
jgi:hypothetical protein